MHKKYFILIIVVLALLGTSYYLNLPQIETTKPTVSKMVQAVYAPGNVESTVMLPILPKVIGRTMKIHVEEGMNVKKGQLLAEIDVDSLKSSLASQKVKVEFFVKELERQRYLFKNGVIGKESLDSADRDYKAAVYDLDVIKNNIIDAQILAPEDGRIIKKDIDIGQLVDPTKEIFWYATNAELRITAFVDEEEVNAISAGQKVYMKADAVRDKVFEGEVLSITPKGDPVARNFRVRISLPDPDKLMIGMSVECNIVTATKDAAMYIPRSAIKDGKVMLVSYGKLVPTAVKTGLEDPQNVEILDGLSEHDSVAIVYPKLKAGTKVRI